VLTQGNLVDHICVSAEVEVADVHVWERTDDSGQRLSDHPTVAVDVDWRRTMGAVGLSEMGTRPAIESSNRWTEG
jgi:hypothetical protein